MKDPNRRDAIPTFGPIARETWLVTLRNQLRELVEERRNPPKRVELSAKIDPSALRNLVDTPSPFASLLNQARRAIDDIRNPKEKFEATAAPVEVDDIWNDHDVRAPGAASVGFHVLIVVLVMFPIIGFDADPLNIRETFMSLVDPALVLNLPPEEDLSGGGGGGGLEEEEPPSIGELPTPDDEQLVPPTPEVLNLNPILVAIPTVVAPQLINTDALINFALLGAMDGIPGPPSAGPGVGGGMGTGQGRGVGEGGGPGVGEGQGGGFGGGVFRIGGGVTPPTILLKVDPQYSEEARKARFQGTVILQAIVRKDGTVDIMGVVRSVGFGLDENAIMALKQWKFRPGMSNGTPVDVALNIEVNFNLR